MRKNYLQTLLFVLLTLTSILAQKDPDEGKPYEFGFTIDGQQHRHEKKDTRGIIQGEFGFITADGIYHVTVYATDENGDFKILSMRNLRISAPLDGSPFKGEISPEADKYRKQANLPPLPSPPKPAPIEPNALSIPDDAPPAQVLVTTPRVPVKFTTQPTIKPACAGCGYVTTKKPVPGQSSFQFYSDQNKNKQQPTFETQNTLQAIPGQYENTANAVAPGEQPSVGNVQPSDVQTNVPSKVQGSIPQNIPNSLPAPQNIPPQSSIQNVGEFVGGQNAVVTQGGLPNQHYDNTEGAISAAVGSEQANQPPFVSSVEQNEQTNVGGSQGLSVPQTASSPQSGKAPSDKVLTQGRPTYQTASGPQTTSYNQQSPQFTVSRVSGQSYPEPNPLQLPGEGPSSQVSTLPPVSVSDGVIHVGGPNKQDIPIRDKFPGMQDGLPEGIGEKDITNLLYKFHYTVGFHGHYEKGLKNGAKIGGYFVNGRDGISRIVTYVADENGYRPKVRFVNLGLDSDETPKPETEKKFGLKSFEFVWYPI